MKTVAGIDVGTQGTKVVLYDFESKRIAAEGSSSHQLISKPDGTSEQEASWWIAAISQAFSTISKDIRATLCAVGVSGQQHGFVPLDKDGNVLRAVKLWSDTSTFEECQEITDAFGGEARLLSEVGNLMLPGYTAPKILWLKKHYPQLYQKMATILLPHDYINWYLTGNYVTEPGDASGTALLSVRERTWNRDVLRALDPQRDLTACLPDIQDSESSSGTVSETAAEEFGIPSGIPVSSGGGDNMMGAIGTGAVSSGVLTVSLGTSGTLYGYSDRPIVDQKGRLAAFCSSTGGWLPLLCTMNCTVASELTRKLFDRDIAEFNTEAQQAPPGSEGVLMLPFFTGERSPNLPKGRGCIVGLNSSNMKESNIARSAMESAVYGLKMGLEAFTELGFDPREIRLVGGGAKSPLWRQITADIFNLPVVVPEINEAAAFGAALQALWCSESRQRAIAEITADHVQLDSEKACRPQKDYVPAYEDGYNTYRPYVEALSPLFS